MSRLFAGATDFHKPINAWDTSSVVTMEQMFAGAHAFNHPLNRLDVSSVTSMYFMFNAAKVRASHEQKEYSGTITHFYNLDII